MNKQSPRERLIARRNGEPVVQTADPVIAVAASQARLSRQQLKALEERFPARTTDNPTLAAQYLGQQQVLAEIRRSFSD